jgi:hypothetical protein
LLSINPLPFLPSFPVSFVGKGGLPEEARWRGGRLTGRQKVLMFLRQERAVSRVTPYLFLFVPPSDRSLNRLDAEYICAQWVSLDSPDWIKQ